MYNIGRFIFFFALCLLILSEYLVDNTNTSLDPLPLALMGIVISAITLYARARSRKPRGR